MSIDTLLRACAMHYEERQLLEFTLRLMRRRALSTFQEYRLLKKKINDITAVP